MQTTNLACVPTIQTLETQVGTNATLFQMPASLALRVSLADCKRVIAQFPSRLGPGTRIDAARNAALETDLAAGKVRGIRIAGRDATIVTQGDHLFVFWPRDPQQTGGGGALAPSAPTMEPRGEIETFVGGLRAQPFVCAPCDPGSPNHPDCDTTPPTGPRGGGTRFASTCTQTQCAELIPIYCPASDGGTATSDAGTGGCECADTCCSR